MALTKWDALETISSLQEEVDKLFNRRLTPARNHRDYQLTQNQWAPSVDIHEDKEAFYFDVEVPGIKKDALDVNIENSVLTIKGEKKKEEEKKDANYYRLEREYGVFSRSFSLPEIADTEKVAAEYQDGILRVKIAKREAAKPKKVQIDLK